MEEIIKRTFKDNCKLSIIESIIIIIIGFILIIKPTLALKTVINILGVIFLSVGIFKMINYLLTKKKNNFYSYDAIFGIFAFILGIIMIIYSIIDIVEDIILMKNLQDIL